jgi:hypothetical protein
MNTAEELGAAFGLDVTDEAFWTASLDVIGDRIASTTSWPPSSSSRMSRRCTPLRRRGARRAAHRRTALPPRPGVAGLYTQLAAPADITTMPKALRERLAAELPTSLTQVVRKVSDDGDTVKYLWELHDGSRIETVLMLYPDRVTVCVSSQAGCAMACGFCATGQAGFTRHLTVGEIVEQVVVAARDARAMTAAWPTSCSWAWASRWPTRRTVWGSVERMHGDLGLSARHITVSTVGLIPASAS